MAANIGALDVTRVHVTGFELPQIEAVAARSMFRYDLELLLVSIIDRIRRTRRKLSRHASDKAILSCNAHGTGLVVSQDTHMPEHYLEKSGGALPDRAARAGAVCESGPTAAGCEASVDLPALARLYDQSLEGLEEASRRLVLRVTGVLLDGALRALLPKYLEALEQAGAFSARLEKGPREKGHDSADFIFGFMGTYNAYGCHAQAHDDDDDQPLRGYEHTLETCGLYVRLLDSPDHSNMPDAIKSLHVFVSQLATRIALPRTPLMSSPPRPPGVFTSTEPSRDDQCCAARLDLSELKREDGFISLLSPAMRVAQRALPAHRRVRCVVRLTQGHVVTPLGPVDAKQAVIDCSSALFRISDDAAGEATLQNLPDDLFAESLPVHWLPFAPSRRHAERIFGEDSKVRLARQGC